MTAHKNFRRFIKRLRRLRQKAIPKPLSKHIKQNSFNKIFDCQDVSKIQIKIINSLRKKAEKWVTFLRRLIDFIYRESIRLAREKIELNRIRNFFRGKNARYKLYLEKKTNEEGHKDAPKKLKPVWQFGKNYTHELFYMYRNRYKKNVSILDRVGKDALQNVMKFKIKININQKFLFIEIISKKLKAIYNSKIVYQDIKPANILIFQNSHGQLVLKFGHMSYINQRVYSAAKAWSGSFSWSAEDIILFRLYNINAPKISISPPLIFSSMKHHTWRIQKPKNTKMWSSENNAEHFFILKTASSPLKQSL